MKQACINETNHQISFKLNQKPDPSVTFGYLQILEDEASNANYYIIFTRDPLFIVFKGYLGTLYAYKSQLFFHVCATRIKMRQSLLRHVAIRFSFSKNMYKPFNTKFQLEVRIQEDSIDLSKPFLCTAKCNKYLIIQKR